MLFWRILVKIALDKLLSLDVNKYVFSRAAMSIIDKIGNIKDYPKVENSKVVTNILNLLLDNKIHYTVVKDEAAEEED